MLKVGILSDTHGYLNPALFRFFKDCDELWHAGDWGNIETVNALKSFKPLKGVYGNIDGREVRMEFPELDVFMAEELKVCMLHIGGYPGRYAQLFREQLNAQHFDLMICGHSHILKVIRDKKNRLLHLNPGAAGKTGFHGLCTALRMKIDGNQISDLEIWEEKRSDVYMQP